MKTKFQVFLDDHPILDFFSWWRIKRLLIDVKYWFYYRFHPSHRYHMLNLQTPDYKHGYIDKDAVILHACFNTLKNFVELEEPFEYNFMDPNIHPEPTLESITKEGRYPEELSPTIEQYRVGKEIKDLYNWWTKDRFEVIKREAELYAKVPPFRWQATDEADTFELISNNEDPSHKAWLDYRSEHDQDEQKMLERLIKIRPWLWT